LQVSSYLSHTGFDGDLTRLQLVHALLVGDGHVYLVTQELQGRLATVGFGLTGADGEVRLRGSDLSLVRVAVHGGEVRSVPRQPVVQPPHIGSISAGHYVFGDRRK